MAKPLQARAVATRNKVLIGAARVFSERGYENSTVADILREGGVTRGAMYFHFASKEEIGRSVLLRQADLVLGVDPESGSSGAQLIVDTSFEFGRRLQDDVLIRAAVLLATERHGFDAEQRHVFDLWLELLTSLCARAMAEGDMRSEMPAAAVARMLSSNVNGIQQSSLIYSNYGDIMDQLETYWRLIGPSLFVSPQSIILPSS